jgi:hypothetical protein
LATLLNLRQGEVRAYAILYGGRQTGKTSLLLRLSRALSPSLCTCHVDWQGLPGATSPQAYHHLAQSVAGCLPQPLAAPQDPDAPGLTRFLCQALDQPGVARLALLMEEFGALPQATREDLANVLRSLFTGRHDRACHALSRLMVVLAGGIELYSLAATRVSALHNICEAVYLPDLTEPDAVGLVADGLAGLGAADDAALAAGQAIYGHVNGHPYLTQRLGGLLEKDLAAGEPVTPEGVERAVEQVLRDDPLLRHLRAALGEHKLAAAAGALLEERPRFSRLDEDLARLELLGLAAESGGCWQVRNRLLARPGGVGGRASAASL